MSTIRSNVYLLLWPSYLTIQLGTMLIFDQNLIEVAELYTCSQTLQVGREITRTPNTEKQVQTTWIEFSCFDELLVAKPKSKAPSYSRTHEPHIGSPNYQGKKILSLMKLYDMPGRPYRVSSVIRLQHLVSSTSPPSGLCG